MMNSLSGKHCLKATGIWTSSLYREHEAHAKQRICIKAIILFYSGLRQRNLVYSPGLSCKKPLTPTHRLNCSLAT
jgi:hypothetical protein